MRKVVAQTFVSLDGVMQAPGGPEEDPAGGFSHGGWTVPYWDDSIADHMGRAMTPPFDLLLGRKTYEIFAAHWPSVPDEPGAAELNSATKYVASKTLKEVEWENSILLGPDVPGEVARLKEGSEPEIQVHGSSDLLQTLIRHDLVDEYRLLIFPVMLGPGKRLFGEGTFPGALRLVDERTSGTGVIMATYERAGEIEVGSFG